MCGICGKLSFAGHAADAEVLVRRMCSVIAHRGPDDEGVYIDPWIAMGNRRLSVIDLVTGHQPMTNEDGTLWIVHNGEIYNYQMLAEQLQRKGHTLSTTSDTEVIVHLYEDLGDDCVRCLSGIFAFALWDTRERRLLLARDRLGVKPLLYFADDQGLVFGSELKAIVQDSHVERRLDFQALNDFLSSNYVPGSRTILAGIRALPAGHILVCEGDRIQVTRYWDLHFTQDQGVPNSEAAYVEGLREAIARAVKMQMVSDVPVGAFLSGGVDSSSIVALMTQATDQRIKTFSVGFEQKSFDELSYARLVSRDFCTDHYEVICSPFQFADLLPDLVWHADGLLADMSMLPLYLVSQLAGQHLKVVLSGDGGDELFAGYSTYQADRLAIVYRRLPSLLRDTVVPQVIEWLPVSYDKMSFQLKAQRFVQSASLPPEQAHASWRRIFSPEEKVALISNEVLGQIDADSFAAYDQAYSVAGDWDELSRHQYADIHVWLVDSILAKVDNMSMAHSLEVRVPFLDHELVEYVATIPSCLRLKGATEKYILRQAVKNMVPPQIVNRRKAGFHIPIDTWFRAELAPFVRDTLTEDRINDIGVFNWPFVERLVSDHLAGRGNHGLKLLGLITFCKWHDLFLRRYIAPTTEPGLSAIHITA
jgi:asparagine synthase (glutamine-hydrolysing)